MLQPIDRSLQGAAERLIATPATSSIRSGGISAIHDTSLESSQVSSQQSCLKRCLDKIFAPFICCFNWIIGLFNRSPSSDSSSSPIENTANTSTSQRSSNGPFPENWLADFCTHEHILNEDGSIRAVDGLGYNPGVYIGRLYDELCRATVEENVVIDQQIRQRVLVDPLLTRKSENLFIYFRDQLTDMLTQARGHLENCRTNRWHYPVSSLPREIASMDETILRLEALIANPEPLKKVAQLVILAQISSGPVFDRPMGFRRTQV